MSRNFSLSLPRTSLLVALAAVVPVLGQERIAGAKQETVPLDSVIAVTEMALNDYQSLAKESKGTPGELPELATADFDFKTVVDTKLGGGVNLFVFTLGATREKQATTDLDFQYAPHPAEKIDIQGFGKDTKTLYQSIIDTLTEASKAVAKAAEANPTSDTPRFDFRQLTLSLSFGVTTDIQGGAKVPFQLITVSGTLDRNKNNVQQVKLAFKQKDPKMKACVPAKGS